MMRSAKRLTMIVLGFVALSTGSLAFAHEDHDALGAGPGVANSTAPAKADDHMDMGSMTSPSMNMAGDEMAMGGMHDEGANKNKSFGERLVSWLGRVHTMVIHFPIALFIGAFAVELFGLWRQNRDYQRAAHVMLVVGALGAIVAAFLGWFAGGFYLSDRNPILMTHRWLGTSIAVFGIGLAYLATAHRRAPDRSRTVYWVLLALMTLAISVQGFLGGTFMHGGLNHLAF
ncbi:MULTISPECIES: DUF2231 domain-containing protein [Pseudomonadota]|uniref:DUF2231 domain-containing protein n=2 Tax=Pseudomonadota TaxID=1224 RepID=UPI000AB4F339|nr:MULTISPECIES: DUF2231 domain-containing protein [Pseudomonadota]